MRTLAFPQGLDDFLGHELGQLFVVIAECCDLFEQGAADVCVSFCRHQKHGFDIWRELMVRHHHGEFACNIGQRSDTSDHHPGVQASDKVDSQPIKNLNTNIRQASGHTPNQFHTLIWIKQRTFVSVASDTDYQVVKQGSCSLDDVQVSESEDECS